MRFARREKYFVTSAVCFLVVLLSWQFVIVPYSDKRERLTRGITVKEAELKEIRQLVAEYQTLTQDARSLEKILARRQKNFSLFAFLENAAGVSGVKSFIKYMKPSVVRGNGSRQESLVEMRLEGITLPLLVSYLRLIESPVDLVVVKKISIQGQQKETGHLVAVLQVTTYS